MTRSSSNYQSIELTYAPRNLVGATQSRPWTAMVRISEEQGGFLYGSGATSEEAIAVLAQELFAWGMRVRQALNAAHDEIRVYERQVEELQ